MSPGQALRSPGKALKNALRPVGTEGIPSQKCFVMESITLKTAVKSLGKFPGNHLKSVLCNKGTTLVGPQIADIKGGL
jgi:hypothetical protein